MDADDKEVDEEDEAAAERAGTAGRPLTFAATVIAASIGDVRTPLAVMTGAVLLTPAAMAVETVAEPSPIKGSVTTNAAINAPAV